MTFDGVEINHGAIVSEDDPMGIFAHEFGHELGAPDLYDIDRWDSNGNTLIEYPVGYWALMAGGA